MLSIDRRAEVKWIHLKIYMTGRTIFFSSSFSFTTFNNCNKIVSYIINILLVSIVKINNSIDAYVLFSNFT